MGGVAPSCCQTGHKVLRAGMNKAHDAALVMVGVINGECHAVVVKQVQYFLSKVCVLVMNGYGPKGVKPSKRFVGQHDA